MSPQPDSGLLLANPDVVRRIRDALVRTDVAQVPDLLIQLANSRGGDDNITVVAVHRVE